jgi:hypothetical protein
MTGNVAGNEIVMTAGGKLGIGRTNPTYSLDVLASGTGVIARFNSANSTGCSLATDGTISCTSDIRLKENISDINYGLNTIMQLNPISFDWKNQDNPNRSLGFIAQDVEELVPELVKTDETTGYKQLNTTGLIPVLTKALQEQQLQINDLKSVQDDVTFIKEILGLSTNETTESTESSNSVSLLSNLQSLISNATEEISNMLSTLGLSNNNGTLVVNSDLNVLGNAAFSNVTVTGELTIGQFKIDSIENSLNITGPACYTSATQTINSALCEAQTLKIMSNLAGNIDIFNGGITLLPDGTIKANKVVAGEYSVRSASETIGTAAIVAGQTERVVTSSKIKADSKIFVTPQGSLTKPLYVKARINGASFTVAVDEVQSQDVTFDWWILDTE